METVSLIIMAVGLAALVGIYVLSRMSRRDIPKGRKLPPINTLMGNNGEEATSIMDDQPARDGKTPSPNAQDFSEVIADEIPVTPQPDASLAAHKHTEEKIPDLPPQLIMFIAAENEEAFGGLEILSALDNAGLTFGDMDVYHRMVLSEEGEKSLFNVANGVTPWTLIPDELAQGVTTPGLSMVLNLPSPISDSEAIHDFVRTAERITSHLGGVLKNQHQETITSEQRQAYFAMV